MGAADHDCARNLRVDFAWKFTPPLSLTHLRCRRIDVLLDSLHFNQGYI